MCSILLCVTSDKIMIIFYLVLCPRCYHILFATETEYQTKPECADTDTLPHTQCLQWREQEGT